MPERRVLSLRESAHDSTVNSFVEVCSPAVPVSIGRTRGTMRQSYNSRSAGMRAKLIGLRVLSRWRDSRFAAVLNPSQEERASFVAQ
jgi:hypothetical protein